MSPSECIKAAKKQESEQYGDSPLWPFLVVSLHPPPPHITSSCGAEVSLSLPVVRACVVVILFVFP